MPKIKVSRQFYHFFKRGEEQGKLEFLKWRRNKSSQARIQERVPPDLISSPITFIAMEWGQASDSFTLDPNNLDLHLWIRL